MSARYISPSSSYGGYCLPKDTKQLPASLKAALWGLIAPLSMLTALCTRAINSREIKHVTMWKGREWA